MVKQVFRYSFKVWITSAALSPILWAVILLYKDGGANFRLSEESLEVIQWYVIFVVVELILSFLTWVLFMVIIFLVIKIVPERLPRTFLIFLFGVLLTVGTFALILFPNGINWDDGFALMCCTAATIGWGAWFYDLKIPDKKIEQTETNPGNF
jgi:hypothetical protein